MQDAIAAATRANVSFYGVDARGVGAGLDEAIEISGMPDETNDSTAIRNEVRRAQDSLRIDVRGDRRLRHRQPERS